MQSNFTSSPDVGQTVEVQLEAEHEPSRAGRKRTRNPDNWTRKHVKRAGLRKNASYLDISRLSGCCKSVFRKFPSNISANLETMSSKISISVVCYTVMRQRRLVGKSVSSMVSDWEGHQLKSASSACSSTRRVSQSRKGVLWITCIWAKEVTITWRQNCHCWQKRASFGISVANMTFTNALVMTSVTS